MCFPTASGSCASTSASGEVEGLLGEMSSRAKMSAEVAQRRQHHTPKSRSSGAKQVAVPPPPPRVQFQNEAHVVGECIGQGAFATVHAFTRVSAGGPPEPLCAKLVYQPRLSAGGRERIKTEMQLWEQLSHPNIIRFVGRAVEEKWLVLVLERASGGELFACVQSMETLSPTAVALWVRQLCAAVEHIHAADIIHRDIKPDNLLLDQHGVLKLTDFGFARRIGAEGARTPCGSIHYMAPERILVLRGAAAHSYGRAADVWAVGVVAYVRL